MKAPEFEEEKNEDEDMKRNDYFLGGRDRRISFVHPLISELESIHKIIRESEKGIDINQCLKLFTEEEQLGKVSVLALLRHQLVEMNRIIL